MSSQPALFGFGPMTLVSDREGGIRYWPDIFDADACHRWLHALIADVRWKSEQRPMYDRIVDVPRLQASFDLEDPSCPPLLREMRQGVSAQIQAPFTHVGLNFYRDARDSVAMHHDRLQHLVPGAPIAIVSLGATREMWIKPQKGGSTTRVPLEAGSLLAMSHASQLTHLHGIPKQDGSLAARISCAFRVRRASSTAH